MKHRAYLLAALALLGWPNLGQAQNTSSFSGSTVTGVPWAGDRALGEGQGIKTGSVEWHPGASAEVGYDSNYLQRANSTIDEQSFGSVVPSLRLRVTPQLTVRTRDRSDDPGAGGASLPGKYARCGQLAAPTASNTSRAQSRAGGALPRFSGLRPVKPTRLRASPSKTDAI